MILAVIVALSGQAFPADSAVRQIEIKSSWGGLGKPQNTELEVRHVNGEYRIGSTRVDPANVELLLASIRQPPQMKPTLENLGMTDEWLTNAADKLEKDAERNDGGDSVLYKLGQGSADQKGLFRHSYTDPKFVAKVLPGIFRCFHTDDYPGVKVTILYDDGSRTVISSHSQSEFMLPWKVEGGNATVETFNKNISVALAAIMPERATNRERVSGQGLGLALAWVVMDAIEGDWNLSNVKAHASEALVKIGNVYKILSADINPYHDVTFGVYVKDGKGEGEENLHGELKRSDFPQGFAVTAILLYRDETVFGVDQFLQKASRYEELALSVPWLAKLRGEYPKWGTSLLWVHDKSLSDKAFQNFAADMHALGKDALVNEVRQVQSQVAVLNVSYGDWWLVLPDRRMILWRYESVMGLLGWKKSDFCAQSCTDYQANNGGCVGAVISPEGDLVK
ncbi:MAG TPA: hypothetical protein VFO46_07685 [Candidatus Sulfotelmatobacter sp.]|nr:hypothetical protein [Candidatus Sulfotelmatobacter sp.]